MEITRNTPCPCGSGKRYKDCCGRPDDARRDSGPGNVGPRLDHVMASALQAQRANDSLEAARLYGLALTLAPDNIDALHMLGVVYFSMAQLPLAEELIGRADALSKGALPAIVHNLHLVRQSARRHARSFESLVASRAAQERRGRDALVDSVYERCTKLIAFYPADDVDATLLGHRAALATEHGITGFCFGWRLLDDGGLISRLLQSTAPRFPYCLRWTSVDATAGSDSEVSLAKHENVSADDFFISALAHFRDARYIRINGRPLLLIDGGGEPAQQKVVERWQTICRNQGIECAYIVVTSTTPSIADPGATGADAIARFPRVIRTAGAAPHDALALTRVQRGSDASSYLRTIADHLAIRSSHPSFPGLVVPSDWPREESATPTSTAGLAAFETALRELIYRASLKDAADERIVFIKAWGDSEALPSQPGEREAYGPQTWLTACRQARMIPRHYQSIFGSASPVPIAPVTTAPSSSPVELEHLPEIFSPAHGERTDGWRLTLFNGGGSPCDAPLFWRDTLPGPIIAEHERTLVTPRVQVFCLSDVDLHGLGWASKDGRPILSNVVYPEYCRQWRETAGGVLGESYGAEKKLSTITTRRYESGWHVAHYNAGVYGHWLTEIMPKLLVIREFIRRFPEYVHMPIFMPSTFPEFVYAHMRAVLPHVAIVHYDPQFEYIHADRMLMPTWGIDYVYNQWIGEQTDAISAARAAGEMDRIFVSRKAKSSYRQLDNLAELERIATGAGLTVVYPEGESFDGQVALFRNARLIVGEYGSALHNALFAPRGTLVVALNWVNAVQSRIARLKGHRIGYLLAEDGPVMFSPGAPMQRYTIDAGRFHDALREAISSIT